MSDSVAPLKTAVIVEDDPDVRHLLAEVLESAGFSTVSAGNGIDGVRAVLAYQPLITTLDVNMPGIDGFEAARRIRAQSDTYIIMLTALDEEVDLVTGLGAGADEYLNKPFRPRELRARIEALLRRPRTATAVTAAAPRRQEQTGPSFPSTRSIPQINPAPVSGAETGRPASVPLLDRQPAFAQEPASAQQTGFAAQAGPGGSASPTIVQEERSPERVSVSTTTPDAAQGHWITHRDLRLNPDTRIVQLRDREVDLTRTEFDLLSALLASKRRVRSKADLTLVLRGESYVTSYFVGEADKRAIEAHMTNLRRKLGDSAAQPRYIETVRGVGYRLTSEISD
ncbi:response regulator transcription factor [Microbacterium sp.]|uniref:response regulator transcription factor n=1 Tax=Microbacterium sp. TaxID=51671 RepID=UPI003F9523FB